MKNPSKQEYIAHRFLKAGIDENSLATIVYEKQKPFNPDLTYEHVIEALQSVMRKRETQHYLVTALSLDELAQESKLPEPFQSIVEDDNPQFGVDEIIGLGASMLGGTISFTNFGALDARKEGIVAILNDEHKKGRTISTFTDDVLSAVIALAEAKVAHDHHIPKKIK